MNANIEITTPTLNESEVVKGQDEGKYNVEEEEDDDDEVEEEDSDEEAAEERARAARKKRREAILAKYRSSKVTADDAVSVENKSSKPNAVLSSSKVSPRVSKVVAAEKKDEPQQKFDIFDMSSKPIVVAKTTATMRRGSADHSNLQDNWDDADGYYTAQIGEVLNDRYKVTGHSGQGVFSSVLFCTDTSVDGAEGGKTPSRVAIKIIRANETMRKASETELKILKEIAAHEHVGRKFNIRLIQQFSYRNHVCLVFEALQMNLRVLLKKFAKGVGISIAAVRRFSKQLFLALRQLRILDVVHADLKPDNILVTGDHQSIKICDFGSAFKVDDGANQVTPYLVSRFYRGPEIILGLPYDTAVDIWSAGCCIYEMFSSKVLFSGRTNNLMIDKFMHIKGPIPRKMVRAHLRSYEMMQRMPFFNDDFQFRRQDTDPVTKQDIVKLVTYTRPTKSLGDMLNAHLGHGTSRKLVNHLRDLLEKTFLLDPARRITAKEALEHPFLRSDVAKTAKKKKAFDATRGWR